MYHKYDGKGCNLQIQGDWCILNMIEVSVNVTSGADNKSIFSFPPNITIRDNTNYQISSVLLGSNWQPTNVLLYISLQGREINVRSTQSYTNGVICAQIMIPKDMILSIN